MSDVQAKDFLPIRVSTLRGDLKIPFDTYVQVAGKYIMYCRNGDSFEGSRLNRLKDKKIKKLYIRLDQEDPYRQYVQSSIDMAYDSKSHLAPEVRVEVVQGHQMAAAERIIESPEDEKSYLEGKVSSQRLVEFIKQDPLRLKIIMDIQNSDSNLAHHGVNVSTLAIGMVSHMDLDPKYSLDALALGCLIHDLEHFYTPVPFSQPESSMTPQEKDLYRQHPERAVERVRALRHFDEDVTRIILEHEELINGEGFPRGLREIDMNPLSLIASTANAFDRVVSFQKLSAKEALKHMLIERIGLHPLVYVKALQECLKSSKLI